MCNDGLLRNTENSFRATLDNIGQFWAIFLNPDDSVGVTRQISISLICSSANLFPLNASNSESRKKPVKMTWGK